MRNPLTLLLSTMVMVSGLHAEEASEKLNFKEIRLIPIGFQETIFKDNDWKLIHTYPHEIAELHFFDGDKKLRTGGVLLHPVALSIFYLM